MTREEKETFMENLSQPLIIADTQMNQPSEECILQEEQPLTVDQEVSKIAESVQAPPHYLPNKPDLPPMGPEVKMVLNTYQQNFKDFQTAGKEGNQMLENIYLHQCLSNHITLERMIGLEQSEKLQIPINPRQVLEKRKKGKQTPKVIQGNFQPVQSSSNNQNMEIKPLSKNQFRKQKKNHLRQNQNKRNLADFLQ
ncbi:hypothetical protein PPACK8108_LOCUS613, partial [Phakopsora pachyrhizi]